MHNAVLAVQSKYIFFLTKLIFFYIEKHRIQPYIAGILVPNSIL